VASFSSAAFDSAAAFSVTAWDFGGAPPPVPPFGGGGAAGGQGGADFRRLIDEIFEEELHTKVPIVTVGPGVTDPALTVILTEAGKRLRSRRDDDDDLMILFLLD